GEGMSLPPKDEERRSLALKATPTLGREMREITSNFGGFTLVNQFKVVKLEDRRYIAAHDPQTVLGLYERIEKLQSRIRVALLPRYLADRVLAEDDKLAEEA